MRKKICPRPQCEKEYLEVDLFDNITVCKLCGAPLEEVFVEDYIVENNDEGRDNIKFETESDIYEEDFIDELKLSEQIEGSFEDKNCFVDIDVVNHGLEKEVIVASENAELDDKYLENKEASEEKEDVDEEENPYENIKGNNLILYKDNEVFEIYELKYDEMIIGRNSSEFNPDIDLSEIDNENATSRKHLLIYKENDNYYIRNLSKKCSVHIKRYDENEAIVVQFNESVIIEDGDFIVLSGKFILEAFFDEVEE